MPRLSGAAAAAVALLIDDRALRPAAAPVAARNERREGRINRMW